MAIPNDLKLQLSNLSEADRKAVCDDILNGLSQAPHDAVLKTGLTALAAEKASSDKRLKDVLSTVATASDDTLRMAYKEYSDEMRHFSTVRSALTTFLLTVSVAALSAYFNRSQTHPFLLAVSVIFALAAILVCLLFSWRTSRAFLRRKRVWNYFANNQPIDIGDKYPSLPQTLLTMISDFTNWLLVLALCLIGLAFCYRDSLGNIFPPLPPAAETSQPSQEGAKPPAPSPMPPQATQHKPSR